MIKKLKRALGGEVGFGRLPQQGVVGRVDITSSGNSVLHVGPLAADGSWSKSEDGGHVVLTPGEREELIETLESHRDYDTIELGDVVTVGGDEFQVLAVQYLNATADGGRLRGTLLAYCDRKREWAVFTAGPHGEVNYATYARNSQDALNAYATRIVEHLYPHFNAAPPSLTFAHVTDRDKLRSDA